VNNVAHVYACQYRSEQKRKIDGNTAVRTL